MLIFLVGVSVASFMFVITCAEKINFQVLIRRSRCDHCLKNLSLFELIPIISFLLLRGRCSKCKTKISARLFYVELLLGVSYIFPLLFSIDTEYLSHYYLFISFLIPLSIIDFEKLIVPNHMLVLLTICSIILFPVFTDYFWIKFILLIFIFLIYPMFSNFIGFGDIKLFMILFIIFPTNLFILIFLFTFIIGGTSTIFFEYILKDKNTVYPLIPFITTAFIIVMINLKDLEIIFGGLL